MSQLVSCFGIFKRLQSSSFGVVFVPSPASYPLRSLLLPPDSIFAHATSLSFVSLNDLYLTSLFIPHLSISRLGERDQRVTRGNLSGSASYREGRDSPELAPSSVSQRPPSTPALSLSVSTTVDKESRSPQALLSFGAVRAFETTRRRSNRPDISSFPFQNLNFNMDSIKSAISGSSSNTESTGQEQGGGFMDKASSALGGGQSGEAKGESFLFSQLLISLSESDLLFDLLFLNFIRLITT